MISSGSWFPVDPQDGVLWWWSFCMMKLLPVSLDTFVTDVLYYKFILLYHQLYCSLSVHENVLSNLFFWSRSCSSMVSFYFCSLRSLYIISFILYNNLLTYWSQDFYYTKVLCCLTFKNVHNIKLNICPVFVFWSSVRSKHKWVSFAIPLFLDWLQNIAHCSALFIRDMKFDELWKKTDRYRMSALTMQVTEGNLFQLLFSHMWDLGCREGALHSDEKLTSCRET